MSHHADIAGAVLREASLHFDVNEEKGPEGDVFYKFIIDHQGKKHPLFLQYRSAVSVSRLTHLASRLAASFSANCHVGLIVKKASQSLLEACKEKGVCVFDYSGNAYVRIDEIPGFHIERYKPEPESHEGTSGTVFTARASRIVRALLALENDAAGRSQTELVRLTQLSRGYVSKVIGRLVSARYASKTSGHLFLEDADQLLDDWVAHYRFDRHKKLFHALSMNTYDDGLKKLVEQLRASGANYALTGWSGAYLRAAHATPDVLMAYVDREPAFSQNVWPVEKQGNVMLLIPQDSGVFQFTQKSRYGAIVSDAQLYIDLRKMPGRAREQANELRAQVLGFRGARHGGR